MPHEIVQKMDEAVELDVTVESKSAATFLGLRVTALFEMLILLAMITGASFLFEGGQRFIGVKPHPFWAVLLLIVAQYGTKEALICTVFASLFLYVGNLPSQDIQGTFEYFFDLLYLPLLWMTVSLVIGELVTKQISERDRLSRKLGDSEREKRTITEAYKRMKTNKETLETRLAGELKSSITVFDMAKTLKSLEKHEINYAIEKVILSVMQPKKFSVFEAQEKGFVLSNSYGWEDADEFEEEYGQNDALSLHIMGNKKVLSIINESEQKILSAQGVMACPIINSATGEIYGMLKIEMMDFDLLTSTTIETFRMLGEWVGAAYSNANRFAEVRADSIMNYDHMLFSYSFFKKQQEFLVTLAMRIGFDLSMITVRLANAGDLDDQGRNQSAKQLGSAVRHTLRRIDHVFNERRRDSEFAIMLPGTPLSDCHIVVDKIERELDKQQDKSIVDRVWYSFTVQTLYEKGGVIDKK